MIQKGGYPDQNRGTNGGKKRLSKTQNPVSMLVTAHDSTPVIGTIVENQGYLVHIPRGQVCGKPRVNQPQPAPAVDLHVLLKEWANGAR